MIIWYLMWLSASLIINSQWFLMVKWLSCSLIKTHHWLSLVLILCLTLLPWKKYDFKAVPVCTRAVSIINVEGWTSMKTCKNHLPRKALSLVHHHIKYVDNSCFTAVVSSLGFRKMQMWLTEQGNRKNVFQLQQNHVYWIIFTSLDEVVEADRHMQ